MAVRATVSEGEEQVVDVIAVVVVVVEDIRDKDVLGLLSDVVVEEMDCSELIGAESAAEPSTLENAEVVVSMVVAVLVVGKLDCTNMSVAEDVGAACNSFCSVAAVVADVALGSEESDDMDAGGNSMPTKLRAESFCMLELLASLKSLSLLPPLSLLSFNPSLLSSTLPDGGDDDDGDSIEDVLLTTSLELDFGFCN